MIPYTTDYTNIIICKRTRCIQTKHHVKFNCFISKDMLQEGLEQDQITVNQMGNKVTATEQLDNQKFIQADDIASMKTVTLALLKKAFSRP